MLVLVVVLGKFHIEDDNEHDGEDEFQERVPMTFSSSPPPMKALIPPLSDVTAAVHANTLTGNEVTLD
jgi:hypothetical protein